MTTWLLDGSVLVALTINNHEHHRRCLAWTEKVESFATCPITEGNLLRIYMLLAQDPAIPTAWGMLEAIHKHPKHVFWPDNFSYREIKHQRLTGHRQITDAWLAELARRKNGKLATLDDALSVLWPDICQLVPV
jgi:uncharacterized protein